MLIAMNKTMVLLTLWRRVKCVMEILTAWMAMMKAILLVWVTIDPGGSASKGVCIQVVFIQEERVCIWGSTSRGSTSREVCIQGWGSASRGSASRRLGRPSPFRIVQDMVNKQAVCILLECILVPWQFWGDCYVLTFSAKTTLVTRVTLA